jgi:FMN phosphatase YigB (HAD superfamily)
MMLSQKVILTDCDGVLLDWEYGFDRWMCRHGYNSVMNDEYQMHIKYGIDRIEAKRLIRMFNESATIRKLSPFRDAIKYVRKLHEEHGYIFHAITSLSNDEYAQHLRTKNLCELFGPTVFEKYVYLDCGADKDDALEDYRDTGCFWIEDKASNCDTGISLGLRGMLVAHGHNADYVGLGVRVSNWKEIYNLITG